MGVNVQSLLGGDGFLTTKISQVANWGRKKQPLANAIWNGLLCNRDDGGVFFKV